MTRMTHAQILFLSGLTLIIGPHKTFYFFARKQKLRGAVCFIGGILLVFFKWPFVGVIVETFGYLNLFGCVLPFGPLSVPCCVVSSYFSRCNVAPTVRVHAPDILCAPLLFAPCSVNLAPLP